MSTEGKDKYKYEKIFQKQGVMSKGKTALIKNGRPVVVSEFIGRYGENKALDEKWDKYGHKCEGRPNILDVMTLDPKSMIDIGAGYNEFIDEIRAATCYNKSKFIGVDIACPGADVIAPAHNLPFEDQEFDMIVSFDCMEHIPEEEVPLAIKEFHRVGKRIYLKIAMADSPTLIDGEGLHVCVKPVDWWLEQIREYFPEAYIRQHDRKGTPAEYIVVYG